MSPGSLRPRDDRDAPGKPAQVVMLASVVLVAALFAYMVAQALSSPGGTEPTARRVEEGRLVDGTLRVEVEVRNDAERGLFEVVVQVPCAEPALEVTLDALPARGERRLVFLCPGDATDTTPRIAAYAPT